MPTLQDSIPLEFIRFWIFIMHPFGNLKPLSTRLRDFTGTPGFRVMRLMILSMDVEATVILWQLAPACQKSESFPLSLHV